jgi:hypothetical protein
MSRLALNACRRWPTVSASTARPGVARLYPGEALGRYRCNAVEKPACTFALDELDESIIKRIVVVQI